MSDVLAALYEVADDDERQVLDHLRLRAGLARPGTSPAPAVRCGCKTGSARDPGTHNNQVRNQGRCYCTCHQRI